MQFKIVPKGDIHSSDMEEKRRLKGEWTALRNSAVKSMTILLWVSFIAAALIMMCDVFRFFPVLLSTVLLLLAITMIKLDEYAGYFVFFASELILLIYTSISRDDIAVVAGVIALLFSLISLFKMVLLMKNYKVLSALKKEKGYPSFFENSSDMFGSQVFVHQWDYENDTNLSKKEREALRIERERFFPFGEASHSDDEQEIEAIYAKLPEKTLPPVPKTDEEINELIQKHKREKNPDLYFEPNYAPCEEENIQNENENQVNSCGNDIPEKDGDKQLSRINDTAASGRKRSLRVVRWDEGGQRRCGDISEQEDKDGVE